MLGKLREKKNSKYILQILHQHTTKKIHNDNKLLNVKPYKPMLGFFTAPANKITLLISSRMQKTNGLLNFSVVGWIILLEIVIKEWPSALVPSSVTSILDE